MMQTGQRDDASTVDALNKYLKFSRIDIIEKDLIRASKKYLKLLLESRYIRFFPSPDDVTRLIRDDASETRDLFVPDDPEFLGHLLGVF